MRISSKTNGGFHHKQGILFKLCGIEELEASSHSFAMFFMLLWLKLNKRKELCMYLCSRMSESNKFSCQQDKCLNLRQELDIPLVSLASDLTNFKDTVSELHMELALEN